MITHSSNNSFKLHALPVLLSSRPGLRLEDTSRTDFEVLALALKTQGLGLGLGLETQGLGLGLGLEKKVLALASNFWQVLGLGLET